MTGEKMAEVQVARSAPIALLSLEIERVTGKAADSIRLLRSTEQSCLGAFDALDKQLGLEQDFEETVHLRAVLVGSSGSSSGHATPGGALPYAALERDYLPANGSMYAALGRAFQTSDPWSTAATTSM